MTSLPQQARQIGLLRLLLLALALAVLVLAVERKQVQLASQSVEAARILLVVVATVSGVLAFLVSWTRHRWQLVLHLVFDLLWIGGLLYLTGGVLSPGVPLLFAVVMIANIVLPGVVSFIMPAIAGLVLSLIGALYLAQASPLPDQFFNAYPSYNETHRILGSLATQVAALFTVDLLAQLLTKRMREHRLFTDRLLDQLGEGVVAIDASGSIAYANDEARRLLQLDEDCRGKPAAQVFSGRLRELATDEQLPRLERFDSDDGRDLVLRATRLYGSNGGAVGRTILIADETRLRLLELNAQRADHLASLGEMAAGIAHEVRNPLTSLRGCAQELSEMNRHASPDAAALADIMVSEADRLGRIVNDFLSLSRLRPPDRRPIDLVGILHDIDRLVRLRTDLPTGLSFRIDVQGVVPPIMADTDQIRQLFQNLIANSVDAVREVPDPSLVCRVEAAPESNALGQPAVELRIEDNGCGIPQELKERIFTPFFSTKAQGTGLGLSLVSRIVREHEGLISMDSAIGTGTSIVILLPAYSPTRTFRRALGG